MITEKQANEIISILPDRAKRDDSTLPANANSTEVYNQEAQNNMADGWNFCLDEVIKNVKELIVSDADFAASELIRLKEVG